tara:strand:+ start:9222 stop:10844 length:1623 start_codon:yes stop_codon:yes gene_type:complete
MPYLGASGDVPGANIKSYRYKQGTDTSTGATSFPAVNKGADELRVYLNGALLKLTADYTFTTSAVTISPAPADDDEIQIDVYTSMNLADAVSSSDGGNFVGAVTFQAGVKTGAVKAQDGTSAITIADSTGKVTIPGDLEIQGTTTTIDTNVESVDKLEVGANSSDYAVSITQSGAGVGLDINGSELVLDADADTSIHASTDDQIDIKVGGTDKVTIDSTALKTDDIQEKTTDHGVEIEQVTLKDGGGTFTGNVDFSNASDAIVTIKSDEANSAGNTDVQLKLRLDGADKYTIGVDDDDSDKLKVLTGGGFAGSGITMDSSGNVGIGTNIPSVPLHTHQTTGNNSVYVTTDNDTNDSAVSAVWLAHNYSTSPDWAGIIFDADDKLRITNSGSGNSDHFVIDDAGNIGISTESPQSKFHVNGEMRDSRGILSGLYLHYASSEITSNSSTSITQINGYAGIIKVVAQHTTYIPFWTTGGAGVGYTIMWIDPDSGTNTSGSFTYSESGSNANTYSVSIGYGNGVLYFQATTMPSNYTVYVYRWF